MQCVLFLRHINKAENYQQELFLEENLLGLGIGGLHMEMNKNKKIKNYKMSCNRRKNRC